MKKQLVHLYKSIFGKTLRLKTVRLPGEVKNILNYEFTHNWDYLDGKLTDNTFIVARAFGFWTRHSFRPNMHGVIIDKGGWTEIELFLHMGVSKVLFFVCFSFIFFAFCIHGVKQGNYNRGIELAFVLGLLPVVYHSYHKECKALIEYFVRLLDAHFIDEDE